MTAPTNRSGLVDEVRRLLTTDSGVWHPDPIIATILAIEAAGCSVVPNDPTPGVMDEAPFRAGMGLELKGLGAFTMAEIYRAMLAANPYRREK